MWINIKKVKFTEKNGQIKNLPFRSDENLKCLTSNYKSSNIDL